MTSVGPSRFIQRICSWAIGSGSIKETERSLCVLTCIWSIVHTARSENTIGLISHWVSLVISTLTAVPPPVLCFLPAAVFLIGIYYPGDQAVPDHITAVKVYESNIINTSKDILNILEP